MRYLVLGGGIAGVCCVEELCKLCPQDSVDLLSTGNALKGVGKVVRVTDNLEDFESKPLWAVLTPDCLHVYFHHLRVLAAVVDRDVASLPYPNLTVHQGAAASLSAQTHQVLLKDGSKLSYDKLCICTGAVPKVLWHNPRVVVLRDQETIETLARQLPGMRRVVLVGNGGIALEVAHSLTGVEVVWAVKHSHIGDAFFDLDAAAFLSTQLPQARSPAHSSEAQDLSAQHSALKGSAAQRARAGPPKPQKEPNPVQCHADDPRLYHTPHEATTHQSSHNSQQPNYTISTVNSSSAGRSAGESSAAQPSPTQQVSAAQAPSTCDPCANSSASLDSADGQVDSAAQNSAERLNSAQDPDLHHQHALPQRTRQMRRGKHRHTDRKSTMRSKDQPIMAEVKVRDQQGQMSFGHAVGPHWASQLPHSPSASHITLEYGVDVTNICSSPLHRDHIPQSARQQSAAQHSAGQPTSGNNGEVFNAQHEEGDEQEWPVTVYLSSGKSYGADLVISAIGVEPNTSWMPEEVKRDASDGGIVVDRLMQSSVAGVYAAGDACTIAWTDKSPQWFQMRLWTQARTQGMFAAHAMAGVTDEMAFGFNFELFTHVTSFCGRKVVLLGLYNGQGLEEEPETDMVSYSRTTEGLDPTFVRVLLLRGRMQGAVLVGETELEETFEHLILDGLDLTRYGPDLLAPDVELEMVFD